MKQILLSEEISNPTQNLKSHQNLGHSHSGFLGILALLSTWRKHLCLKDPGKATRVHPNVSQSTSFKLLPPSTYKGLGGQYSL